MKEVINFIQENGRLIVLILDVILVAISLILLFRKKKNVVNEFDNILKVVLSNLPRIIASAETLIGDGNGEAKKSLVLSSIAKFVKDQFSVDLPDSIMAYLSERIEDILATPQKKEGTYEKRK